MSETDERRSDLLSQLYQDEVLCPGESGGGEEDHQPGDIPPVTSRGRLCWGPRHEQQGQHQEGDVQGRLTNIF